MSIDRMLRVNALIQQEVAAFLPKEINEPDFDLSAVTVTKVVTSSNLRQSRVFVSLRASPDRQQVMLQRLRQHRIAIQNMISKRVAIKYTPLISFELDESIAKGDHVLHIISEMETEHPDWPVRPTSEPSGHE
ncbi:MAG: 30S ribosome-binding factor RbfA [bacterium]